MGAERLDPECEALWALLSQQAETIRLILDIIRKLHPEVADELPDPEGEA